MSSMRDSQPPPPPPLAAQARAGRTVRLFGVVLLLLIVVNVALLAVLSLNLVDRIDPTTLVPPEPSVEQPRSMPVPDPSVTSSALPPPAQTAQPAPPPLQLPLSAELDQDERRTVAIFRQAAPAVVFITTIAYQQDTFRRNVTAIPSGTGSGFVWDEQGHIVTNYHVIRGADAAKVTLDDQTSFDAKLIGYAVDKDIAVLRIDAPAGKLKPLARGTSADLVVGQRALAIGNPFGLDHTLSTGVVSGLEREIKSLAGRPIVGVIQTDAAINPGNSGGPLLDSRGRLIGINTAIFSPSGSSAGIGFAVPVDTVSRIVPQLITHGKVTRPGLGIHFDPELQRRNNIPGVLVLGVAPGGAADKAGIVPTRRDTRTGQLLMGDIIVGMDGSPINHQDDLFKLLDQHKVGDTVKLSLRRGKDTVKVDVKLTELPELEE